MRNSKPKGALASNIHAEINTADTKSSEELAQRYLPLVRHIAGRIAPRLPDHLKTYAHEDLYSVGVTALMKSLSKYDPSRAASFDAYICRRVEGAMLDELRREDKMPRNARGLYKKIRAAIQELEFRLGRPPTEKETMTELGMGASEYRRALLYCQPLTHISIDNSQVEESEKLSLHECLADDQTDQAFSKIDGSETRKLIAEQIMKLPKDQKNVLMLYYYNDMRLAEIGEIMGLAESRISQIRAQAILALRTFASQIHEQKNPSFDEFPIKPKFGHPLSGPEAAECYAQAI